MQGSKGGYLFVHLPIVKSGAIMTALHVAIVTNLWLIALDSSLRDKLFIVYCRDITSNIQQHEIYWSYLFHQYERVTMSLGLLFGLNGCWVEVLEGGLLPKQTQ